MKRFLLSLVISCLFTVCLYSNHMQYYCTASDAKYFSQLTSLIGSIHKTNIEHLGGIIVFDLGLETAQINELKRMQKVSVHKLKLTHPDLLKQVPAYVPRKGDWWAAHAWWASKKMVPGYYAWKIVAIKQALDTFDHILWIDAGNVVLKPLDDLFNHILEHGSFFICANNLLDLHTTQRVRKKFNLESDKNKWILQEPQIEASVIGIHKRHSVYQEVILPCYELTRDLKNFENDGTSKHPFPGFEQAILSLHMYKHGLRPHMYKPKRSIELTVNDQTKPFFIDEWPVENSHIGYVRGKGKKYDTFVKYRE